MLSAYLKLLNKFFTRLDLQLIANASISINNFLTCIVSSCEDKKINEFEHMIIQKSKMCLFHSSGIMWIGVRIPRRTYS